MFDEVRHIQEVASFFLFMYFSVAYYFTRACLLSRRLMLNSAFEEQWFHAVDLDPFGSASPFVEGALQCVADGGEKLSFLSVSKRIFMF